MAISSQTRVNICSCRVNLSLLNEHIISRHRNPWYCDFGDNLLHSPVFQCSDWFYPAGDCCPSSRERLLIYLFIQQTLRQRKSSLFLTDFDSLHIVGQVATLTIFRGLSETQRGLHRSTPPSALGLRSPRLSIIQLQFLWPASFMSHVIPAFTKIPSMKPPLKVSVSFTMHVMAKASICPDFLIPTDSKINGKAFNTLSVSYLVLSIVRCLQPVT